MGNASDYESESYEHMLQHACLLFIMKAQMNHLEDGNCEFVVLKKIYLGNWHCLFGKLFYSYKAIMLLLLIQSYNACFCSNPPKANQEGESLCSSCFAIYFPILQHVPLTFYTLGNSFKGILYDFIFKKLP